MSAIRDGLDLEEIEQRLRDELAAAMERLNRSREKAGEEPREYRDALAALEQASIRFADFVLSSVVPDEYRAPNTSDRSASSGAR